MSILDKLKTILDDPEALRARVSDLEDRCRALHKEKIRLENELMVYDNELGVGVLVAENETLKTRLRNVTAGAVRLLKLFAKEWVGGEQQAIMRAVAFVVEKDGEQ